MPFEVARESTRSSAVSGPVSGNSRVPWPTTTGPRGVDEFRPPAWAAHEAMKAVGFASDVQRPQGREKVFD
jgi:hypothetical protein